MAEPHPESMDPQAKEAYHREAEAGIKVFNYDAPTANNRPKQVAWLVKRPIMNAFVQIVRKHGENNLHYHTNSETFWLVLRGRARFTGHKGQVLAEIGPMGGIHIPGGSRYKFSSIGDEDLEILQVVSIDDATLPAERINYEEPDEATRDRLARNEYIHAKDTRDEAEAGHRTQTS